MMTLSEKHKIISALLFSADDPLTEKQVELCLQENIDLAAVCAELNTYYQQKEIPLEIHEIAGGYRLMVPKRYDNWISRLYQNRGTVKLTRSALETLSIIAYKQPVTKSDIDAIRGVSSYLKTLLEKNLIEIKGRLDAPGRPLLYGTTQHFLEYFGLSSIKDLPKLKEIEELLDEHESEPEIETDTSQ